LPFALWLYLAKRKTRKLAFMKGKPDDECSYQGESYNERKRFCCSHISLAVAWHVITTYIGIIQAKAETAYQDSDEKFSYQEKEV
jgi:hypothetical protein